MHTAATIESVTQHQQSAANAYRVRALLRLEFARNPETGRTFLAHSSAEPPLKVVRAFPIENNGVLVHLHNVSGGLLGGDQLRQQVRLAPCCRVQLTTTGATRIYRRRGDFAATCQHTEFSIGEGALLEYVPDATIPFAGSKFQQHTSIDLAPGAGLFWWEIFAPGREARGELFAYDQLEIRTRISAAGRLIVAENVSLRPATQDIPSLARLGSYRYLATFYICRVGIKPGFWRALEDSLRQRISCQGKPDETLWGISSLSAHGIAIRCLAQRGRDILPALQSLWTHAKFQLYNEAAIPPRKVH